MNILENSNGIEWRYPWVMILIPLLAVLIYFMNKNKSNATIGISTLGKEKISKTWRIRIYELFPLFQFIALSCMVLALARPQKLLRPLDTSNKGIDILIAMDISSSMLSKDFDPDRLEAAKKVAKEFVKNRPSDRIGLVTFAGESITQCPLTNDHDVLIEILNQIQTGILEDGTAIGMGLGTAVNRLKSHNAKSKVIILMTDGVNNAGYIDPESASELAKTEGCKVYTIGIGSEGMAMTPVARRFDGTYVFGYNEVKIDEELMTRIAEKTGGKYFRARSDSELTDIYNEINKMEKTESKVKWTKQYNEYFRPFLLAGMLLLVLMYLLKWLAIKPITS
jgi:Ca-activated chloride channel family protein